MTFSLLRKILPILPEGTHLSKNIANLQSKDQEGNYAEFQFFKFHFTPKL